MTSLHEKQSRHSTEQIEHNSPRNISHWLLIVSTFFFLFQFKWKCLWTLITWFVEVYIYIYIHFICIYTSITTVTVMGMELRKKHINDNKKLINLFFISTQMSRLILKKQHSCYLIAAIDRPSRIIIQSLNKTTRLDLNTADEVIVYSGSIKTMI